MPRFCAKAGLSVKLLQPQFLHLAWLALVILALHLFRRRAQTREVSTLLFFRWLAHEHREAAWLRQLKKWLALLLSLVVLGLTALALSRPQSEANSTALGSVVVLVDVSASMGAKDAAGVSRLQWAVAELQKKIQALPEDLPISLIAYDSMPVGLLARSSNRRECLRLLGQLEVRPVEDQPALALRLARPLLAMDAKSRLWHASDRPLEHAEGLPVEFFNAALPVVRNVGITAFEIRRAPLSLQRHDLFVAVHAASANSSAMTAELEVSMAGSLVQLRRIELEPGATQRITLPLEQPRGEWLEVRVRAQEDCLGWDDAVAAPCPKPRRLSVVHVAGQADPFTKLALDSLAQQGQLQVISTSPQNWAAETGADLYVFERFVPAELPKTRPSLLLEPIQSCAAFEVRPLAGEGLMQDEVADTGLDHPVLHRLQPSVLALRQTLELRASPSLQPLLMSRGQTLLAAGAWQGQRLVVSAFSPAASQRLTLMPAFPLLLGNALDWCLQPRLDAGAPHVQASGGHVPLQGLVSWRHWNGRAFVEEQMQADGVLPLSRIGLWQQGTQSGLSQLCSLTETSLPTVGRAQGRSQPPEAVLSQLWRSFDTLSQLILWLLLALLILESWLFHRHALY